MINIAAQSGINQSSELNGMTINLNDYIPKTNYYFYRGTLPYSCGSSVLVNYVVFSKNTRNSPINIPEDILNKLNNIIQKQNVEIKPTPDEFGKSKGPPSMSGASSGGDIYIDCQPVGEDGELLINTPKTSMFGDTLQKFDPNKYKWLGSILVGVLIIMILLAFKNTIMNFFSAIFDFIFSYKKQQKGGNNILKRK